MTSLAERAVERLDAWLKDYDRNEVEDEIDRLENRIEDLERQLNEAQVLGEVLREEFDVYCRETDNFMYDLQGRVELLERAND